MHIWIQVGLGSLDRGLGLRSRRIPSHRGIRLQIQLER